MPNQNRIIASNIRFPVKSVLIILSLLLCAGLIQASIITGSTLLDMVYDAEYIFWGSIIATSLLIVCLLIPSNGTLKIPITSGEKKWRPVELQQVVDLTEVNTKAEEIYTPAGQFINKYLCDSLISLIVVVVLHVLMFFDIYHWSFCIMIDMAILPSLFVQFLRYPNMSPDYPFLKLLIDNHVLNVIHRSGEQPENQDDEDRNQDDEPLADINYQTSLQLSIQNDEAGNPWILDDIRCMVSFDNMPKTLLCSMFSFTQNDVNGTKYPYVYFVFVIKLVAENDEMAIQMAMTNIFEDNSETGTFKSFNRFMLEFQSEPDKIVAVIRKKDSAYHSYTTDSEECSQLAGCVQVMMNAIQDGKIPIH